MTYEQVYAGEPVTIALDVRHKLACCDCGKVHTFEVSAGFDGRLILTMESNARATAANRRSKSVQQRIKELAK